MAGPLLVGAEEVLLIPDPDSYAASRPVWEGLELIMQLRDFPTSKLLVVAHTEDESAAETYCKLNGLPKAVVVALQPEDRYDPPATAQWTQIKRQRARGPLNMVITAYREVYERCTATHQPVLLFGRKGSLGNLDSRSSWNELHERVLQQRYAGIEEAMEADD